MIYMKSNHNKIMESFHTFSPVPACIAVNMHLDWLTTLHACFLEWRIYPVWEFSGLIWNSRLFILTYTMIFYSDHKQFVQATKVSWFFQIHNSHAWYLFHMIDKMLITFYAVLCVIEGFWFYLRCIWMSYCGNESLLLNVAGIHMF